MCGNMKFISSVDQDYLTSEESERVRYLVQHENFQTSVYCSVYYLKNSPIAPQK